LIVSIQTCAAGHPFSGLHFFPLQNEHLKNSLAFPLGLALLRNVVNFDLMRAIAPLMERAMSL